jgi:amino acid transporter
MLVAVALVAVTYLVPVGAAWLAGADPRDWTTGAWVDVGRTLGGRPLELAVTVGGMICGFGMFNTLVMSYSRLPLALAEDGYLPRAMARCHPVTGAPWVAIVACAVAYAFALALGFKRLVEVDVLVYGLSVVLEFVALVALRLREPSLPRPFRVPGGLVGAIAIGVPPTLLLGAALVAGSSERAGALSSLELGAIVTALGPLVYLASRRARVAPEQRLE